MASTSDLQNPNLDASGFGAFFNFKGFGFRVSGLRFRLWAPIRPTLESQSATPLDQAYSCALGAFCRFLQPHSFGCNKGDMASGLHEMLQIP